MPIIDSYTLLGAWPQAEVDLSLDALAQGMQSRGVSHSLVTHTTAMFHDPQIGNSQVTQLCSQHAPLVPVAVINPLLFPSCIDEIGRCLNQGFKAFRFCPREHGYPFHASVGPLCEALKQLTPARMILVDLTDIPAPVVSADLIELLPVPTAFTVDAAGLGTIIHAGRASKNVWVETSRLEAGGAVEAAVRHLGANRVVFGSGAPLRGIGTAVMSVQYADIPDADRAAIFEGNIQRALA